MEDKSTKIKERVLEVAKTHDCTLEEFFPKIGMTYGNFKGKSKETPLNSTAVADILTLSPWVDAMWLLTGKGTMRKEKQEFVAHLSEDNKEVGTPLISLEAAAGFGNQAFSISKEDVIARYVVPDFAGIDFMIPVKGSSMYPKYSSGDLVACRIIRELTFIQWNKVYVIATREQGILCKRIKKAEKPSQLLIVSDNKEYEPFEIDRTEITDIALVIGTIRLE